MIIVTRSGYVYKVKFYFQNIRDINETWFCTLRAKDELQVRENRPTNKVWTSRI